MTAVDLPCDDPNLIPWWHPATSHTLHEYAGVECACGSRRCQKCLEHYPCEATRSKP